ncbi:hypothetical protein FRB93_005559 [Tulasnella sp. JGI-2019a]|nr:hypothetical protein FRB93_005559 [Tulasnella sp. JGI-2019a]
MSTTARSKYKVPSPLITRFSKSHALAAPSIDSPGLMSVPSMTASASSAPECAQIIDMVKAAIQSINEIVDLLDHPKTVKPRLSDCIYALATVRAFRFRCIECDHSLEAAAAAASAWLFSISARLADVNEDLEHVQDRIAGVEEVTNRNLQLIEQSIKTVMDSISDMHERQMLDGCLDVNHDDIQDRTILFWMPIITTALTIAEVSKDDEDVSSTDRNKLMELAEGLKKYRQQGLRLKAEVESVRMSESEIVALQLSLQAVAQFLGPLKINIEHCIRAVRAGFALSGLTGKVQDTTTSMKKARRAIKSLADSLGVPDLDRGVFVNLSGQGCADLDEKIKALRNKEEKEVPVPLPEPVRPVETPQDMEPVSTLALPPSVLTTGSQIPEQKYESSQQIDPQILGQKYEFPKQQVPPSAQTVNMPPEYVAPDESRTTIVAPALSADLVSPISGWDLVGVHLVKGMNGNAAGQYSTTWNWEIASMHLVRLTVNNGSCNVCYGSQTRSIGDVTAVSGSASDAPFAQVASKSDSTHNNAAFSSLDAESHAPSSTPDVKADYNRDVSDDLAASASQVQAVDDQAPTTTQDKSSGQIPVMDRCDDQDPAFLEDGRGSREPSVVEGERGDGGSILGEDWRGGQELSNVDIARSCQEPATGKDECGSQRSSVDDDGRESALDEDECGERGSLVVEDESGSKEFTLGVDGCGGKESVSVDGGCNGQESLVVQDGCGDRESPDCKDECDDRGSAADKDECNDEEPTSCEGACDDKESTLPDNGCSRQEPLAVVDECGGQPVVDGVCGDQEPSIHQDERGRDTPIDEGVCKTQEPAVAEDARRDPESPVVEGDCDERNSTLEEDECGDQKSSVREGECSGRDTPVDGDDRDIPEPPVSEDECEPQEPAVVEDVCCGPESPAVEDDCGEQEPALGEDECGDQKSLVDDDECCGQNLPIGEDSRESTTGGDACGGLESPVVEDDCDDRESSIGEGECGGRDTTIDEGVCETQEPAVVEDVRCGPESPVVEGDCDERESALGEECSGQEYPVGDNECCDQNPPVGENDREPATGEGMYSGLKSPVAEGDCDDLESSIGEGECDGRVVPVDEDECSDREPTPGNETRGGQESPIVETGCDGQEPALGGDGCDGEDKCGGRDTSVGENECGSEDPAVVDGICADKESPIIEDGCDSQAFAPVADQWSHFSRTSKNIRLDGIILHADCLTVDNETYQPSSLDLYTILGSDDGSTMFRFKDRSMSTTNISLNGAVLIVDLSHINRIWNRAEIDLDLHLVNHNGVLELINAE